MRGRDEREKRERENHMTDQEGEDSLAPGPNAITFLRTPAPIE